MAVNNNTGNCADTNIKTTGKIDEYKKSLSDSIKNAASAAQIAESACEDAALNKADKEICYNKLNSGFEKYKSLSVTASTTLAKDTEELYNTIVKCKSEVKVAVGKKLESTIKALKKLKEEVKGVSEAACKLESEIADNCNAQQLKIMRQKVTGSCDFDSTYTLTGNNDFEKWISGICQDVKDTVADVGVLQNIAVSAAGVNALVDYTNLEAVSKTLMEKATELNTDVNDNMDTAKDEADTACADLATAIEELSSKTFEERKANLKEKSLYKVCNFVKSGCEPANGKPATWQEVKDKINGLLCNNSSNGIPDPQPRPDDKPTPVTPKKGKKNMG